MKLFCSPWKACLLLLLPQLAVAQDPVKYQQPPAVIADLLLAKPTPGVSVSSNGKWLLYLDRNSYPGVEEIGQPEIRVAGLRLNPNNYAPSRVNASSGLRLQAMPNGIAKSISGLPSPLVAANVSWSPNEDKFAFAQVSNNRVDIYVVDIAKMAAKKVNQQPINMVLGVPFVWVNNTTLMYKVAIVAASKAPAKAILPIGPSVQENLGKVAPSRTYQDLIKTPYDESLFRFYATSQLAVNKDGVEQLIGKPGIISAFSVSPNKQYYLQRTLSEPFSYLVQANGFASQLSIHQMNGNLVKQWVKLPSEETAPSGYDNVQMAPRAVSWRDDEPATLTWVMPLDSGMIRKKVEYRDELLALKAPFTGEPEQLAKTKMRFRGVLWGDATHAVLFEGLTGKQMTAVNWLNTSGKQVTELYERSSNDAYRNPGSPLTTKNQFGRDVLMVLPGEQIVFNNTVGSSPRGDLPFLMQYDLNKKTGDTLWRCQLGEYEYVVEVLDAQKGVVVTRRESQTATPNYYVRSLKESKEAIQITAFKDPYPALNGVSKQKIKYKRADGVDLTGDLYLPKGYRIGVDAPLPVLMWAYPREYNSAADAAQVRGSQDRFTTISWGGPVFWVTQGYAVLDNAEMPIVAANATQKPNDSFLEQLQLNAKAAIGELARMGVGDSNRVAVGGHSYGAFMTANLLAHTKLFKAGIARSGAYNRTLTPFGFQAEDRTYWEAPKLYYDMSPFSFANQIKTPLLLIHGDSDDNPGTFPINSERLYNAVKGHGGTVRYVSLPYEAHSYRGRENLLHMLNEQHQWLEKYVKQAR